MNHNPDVEIKSSSISVKNHLKVISLTFLFILLLIFGGYYYRCENLIKEQLLNQARAFFQEIVLTRDWIANHGGVYVKMREGIEVNPFLETIPGLKVVIRDEEGQKYTLKNPALVTREISELGQHERILKFHITSLTPLNSKNTPDSFEEESLNKFREGLKEVYIFEEKGDEHYFRYMAPLITKGACLKCHGFQGYQVGDIRGGISVSIPATKTYHELNENKVITFFTASAIFISVLIVIVSTSRKSLAKLHESQEKLYKLATRDSLTGVLNRREGFRRFSEELSRTKRTGDSLSLMMIDIDHFKSVNDNYGHQKGDDILKEVVSTILKTLRDYDLMMRYGGEEFALLLPSTAMEKAIEVAERARESIENMDSFSEVGLERITVSIGVSQLILDDTLDILISKADTALYIAKERGRNRVYTN
ncbi:MAG: diguanylate cyclase [Deltaproteobacteria bacterium]|nr:diguanylate cyclase [Deltaproteobacteria bacterium]